MLQATTTAAARNPTQLCTVQTIPNTVLPGHLAFLSTSLWGSLVVALQLQLHALAPPWSPNARWAPRKSP